MKNPTRLVLNENDFFEFKPSLAFKQPCKGAFEKKNCEGHLSTWMKEILGEESIRNAENIHAFQNI